MQPSPYPAQKTGYRADIDGLRAVAVLLVLFDHLHIRCDGGYIGVDVFFVISGYLISSVILGEIEAGRFSIVGFYERRIRRIFPALLVMLLATTAMAYHYLAPSALDSYARSLIAALLSASNMLFWHQAGYFDAPSAAKPLLHTWSLGVEEQFYICFPLLLVPICRSFPRSLKPALIGLATLSFLLACFWVRRDPSAAFYLAPLRGWELLLGAILSQRYLPAIRGKAMRNAAALAGMALILVPAACYSVATPFPGLAALPPCLGAALLIAAGEHGGSLVGSVLAWPPVAFIGLISYSLYLWHWPILIFQNTNSMLLDSTVPNSRLVKIVVLAMSLAVATLSWRFVETPFRRGRLRPSRRALFSISTVAVAAMLLIGCGMIATQGMPSRFPLQALEVAGFESYNPNQEWREGVCFLTPAEDFRAFQPSTCLRDGDSREHYLLFGDSFGAQLYPGLSTVFPGIEFWQATAGNCLPFVNEPVPPVNAPNCLKLSKFIYGDFLLHHHPDQVLLTADWSEPDLPELAHTIAWLHQHGMTVTVFGRGMEFDTGLPTLLFNSIRDRDPALIQRHWVGGNRDFDRKMADLVRNQWNARYISEFDDLCASAGDTAAAAPAGSIQGCPLYAAPGVPLIFDKFHLTIPASALYAEAIRDRRQLP
jgi:peptidoglycan/LPS O-acetylase OafA/YrhL